MFAGLYPVESNEYDQPARIAEKLRLNDASLHSSRKSPRRWASASAAASSACCTWNRAGASWSASST